MKNKNYKYWERVLKKELFSLWERSDKYLSCHGPEHHLRVWQMAKLFGIKKKVDMDVLVAGCLLHDVYSFNVGVPKDHDIGSAKIAEKVLKKIKFPKDKIEQVFDAIKSHRSKSKSNCLEGKIMKSFDKIDAFGPIGVYRVIAPLSIRKYNVVDIVSWAIKGDKLKKKWASIPFSELKRKYKSRYIYSVKYFNNLAKHLGLKKIPKTRISETKINANS